MSRGSSLTRLRPTGCDTQVNLSRCHVPSTYYGRNSSTHGLFYATTRSPNQAPGRISFGTLIEVNMSPGVNAVCLKRPAFVSRSCLITHAPVTWSEWIFRFFPTVTVHGHLILLFCLLRKLVATALEFIPTAHIPTGATSSPGLPHV